MDEGEQLFCVATWHWNQLINRTTRDVMRGIQQADEDAKNSALLWFCAALLNVLGWIGIGRGSITAGGVLQVAALVCLAAAVYLHRRAKRGRGYGVTRPQRGRR